MSERFEGGLRRLGSVFVRHAEAPREPERVTELAQARADLEDQRWEMQRTRTDEDLRFSERRSPKYVDPSIGMRPASIIGVIGAVLGAVGLMAALVLAYLAFDQGNDAEPDLAIDIVREELTPLADGACDWTVVFELENTSDVVLRLRRVVVSLPDASEVQQAGVQLLPGERTSVTSTLVQPSCPRSVDQVRHGPLEVTYSGSTGGQWQTIGLEF